jgi:hypothetical protein
VVGVVVLGMKRANHVRTLVDCLETTSNGQQFPQRCALSVEAGVQVVMDTDAIAGHEITDSEVDVTSRDMLNETEAAYLDWGTTPRWLARASHSKESPHAVIAQEAGRSECDREELPMRTRWQVEPSRASSFSGQIRRSAGKGMAEQWALLALLITSTRRQQHTSWGRRWLSGLPVSCDQPEGR